VARLIYTGDGLAWLANAALDATAAIVTSLPDASEMRMDVAVWSAWFVEAARIVCARVHPDSVAIFFQSDVRHDGRWIDKSYLVRRGADLADAQLLFHKIVCRAPAGTITPGRPAYAHLMAFSRELRLDRDEHVPDVIPRLGAMTWSRAMGIAACEATCAYLRTLPACRTVVDPFCGLGTMLAVANEYGFDAIGVEISPKRAERARTLRVALGR
jgi:hypothetical protein